MQETKVPIIDDSHKITDQHQELESEKHPRDIVKRKLVYDSEAEEQRSKKIEKKRDIKKIQKSNKYPKIEKHKERDQRQS